MGLALEQRRIPDVLVGGRDVPVADQRDLRVRIPVQPSDRIRVQLRQPLQLVRVVRIGELTAVGDVQAPDADAVAGGADGAGFLRGRDLRVLVEPGLILEADLHVVETDTGRDRDTVPLAEAHVRDLVPQFAEPLVRELLVLALGFLHRQHVDVGPLEPVQDPVGTGTNRVHVPGCDAHGSHPSGIVRQIFSRRVRWRSGTGGAPRSDVAVHRLRARVLDGDLQARVVAPCSRPQLIMSPQIRLPIPRRR